MPKKKTPKKNGLEFYAEYKGQLITPKRLQYRWRIYKQGRIIAASTEGYARLQGAVNNAKSVGSHLAFARIIEYAATKFKTKQK